MTVPSPTTPSTLQPARKRKMGRGGTYLPVQGRTVKSVHKITAHFSVDKTQSHARMCRKGSLGNVVLHRKLSWYLTLLGGPLRLALGYSVRTMNMLRITCSLTCRGRSQQEREKERERQAEKEERGEERKDYCFLPIVNDKSPMLKFCNT